MTRPTLRLPLPAPRRALPLLSVSVSLSLSLGACAARVNTAPPRAEPVVAAALRPEPVATVSAPEAPAAPLRATAAPLRPFATSALLGVSFVVIDQAVYVTGVRAGEGNALGAPVLQRWDRTAEGALRLRYEREGRALGCTDAAPCVVAPVRAGPDGALWLPVEHGDATRLLRLAADDATVQATFAPQGIVQDLEVAAHGDAVYVAARFFRTVQLAPRLALRAHGSYGRDHDPRGFLFVARLDRATLATQWARALELDDAYELELAAHERGVRVRFATRSAAVRTSPREQVARPAASAPGALWLASVDLDARGAGATLAAEATPEPALHPATRLLGDGTGRSVFYASGRNPDDTLLLRGPSLQTRVARASREALSREPQGETALFVRAFDEGSASSIALRELDADGFTGRTMALELPAGWRRLEAVAVPLGSSTLLALALAHASGGPARRLFFLLPLAYEPHGARSLALDATP